MCICLFVPIESQFGDDGYGHGGGRYRGYHRGHGFLKDGNSEGIY